MTRREDTERAMAAMRDADPVDAVELGAGLGPEELDAAMRRAVAAGEAGEGPRLAPAVRRRRAVRLGLAAGLAVGLAAVAALVLGGGPGGAGRPEFAAAAVAVAEANPRLLVTAPGWRVTRADQFEPDQGEVSFGDGRHRLAITWYPARYYRRYLRDRSHVGPQRRSTLLGRAATTVHYGRGEYATMLAPRGSVFLELRGKVGGREGYERLIETLRPVDVEAWLAAMPPSAVQPLERADAIDAILRDVPLPPGFDREALVESDAVRDRYQLVVEATGAVACGWVESWLAARRAGDAGAAAEAVRAMATWSRWPALRGAEMRRGWAVNVEQAAKRIAHGKLNHGPAGIEVRADGTGFEHGPQWSLALGCEPSWRRRVEP